MSAKTDIQWTDSTWNPVKGCTRLSPGCGGPNHEGGCYAEKIAARFSGPGQAFHGFAERTPHGGRWTGKLAINEKALMLPVGWKKPRRIFVNSMSDLFHENLADGEIDTVFDVMRKAHWHVFQVLTKRADRMHAYARLREPLPNVWLGVSVEDQRRADERVPLLVRTPAAVRFLSCEPLLEEINLRRWLNASPADPLGAANLDWVIVGGESGPGARPFNVEWAYALRDQCQAAGVPFFLKQLGADPHFGARYYGAGSARHIKDRAGGDWNEWPEDLRRREFPDG